MGLNVLLFSTKNDVNIWNDAIKIINNKTTLFTYCNSEQEFFSAYNLNTDLILYGKKDFPILSKIINQINITNYPKLIETNSLTCSIIMQTVPNKHFLYNKYIMRRALEQLQIFPFCTSALVIKKMLILMANIGIKKSNYKLFEIACRQLNLNCKREFPILREYVKNWYKNGYQILNNKYPFLNGIKLLKTLEVIDQICELLINEIDRSHIDKYRYSKDFFCKNVYGEEFAKLRKNPYYKKLNVYH